MNHQVFVYGTLLKGLSNHERCDMHRAKFVGHGKLIGFKMHDCGYFPEIVKGGSGDVVGEVYDVDDATLERLDQLEGCPHHYQRTRHAVAMPVGYRWSWVYTREKSHNPVVASGDWRKYRDDGDANRHALATAFADDDGDDDNDDGV